MAPSIDLDDCPVAFFACRYCVTTWRAGMPSYQALSAAISSRVGNGSPARVAFNELRRLFMTATLPERAVYCDKKGYHNSRFLSGSVTLHKPRQDGLQPWPATSSASARSVPSRAPACHPKGT